jgi:hypothetical protein
MFHPNNYLAHALQQERERALHSADAHHARAARWHADPRPARLDRRDRGARRLVRRLLASLRTQASEAGVE